MKKKTYIISMLCILITLKSLAQDDWRIVATPLPFSINQKPYVHEKGIVYAYEGSTANAQIWDLTTQQALPQWPAQNTTKWDTSYNIDGNQLILRKPSGEHWVIDLTLGHNREIMKSVLIHADRVFIQYFGGAISSWTVTNQGPERVWQTSSKYAIDAMGYIAFSPDHQHLVLIDQRFNEKGTAGLCAVFDAKSGELIFDSNSVGNSRFVFSSSVPYSLLVNDLKDKDVHQLDLASGTLHKVLSADVEGVIKRSFLDNQNRIWVFSQVEPLLRRYDQNIVSHTIYSAHPKKFIDGTISPSKTTIFAHIARNKCLVNALQLYNTNGNLSGEIPFCTPPVKFPLVNYDYKGYPPQTQYDYKRYRYEAPIFNINETLLFWGNSLFDLTRREVIHVFDHPVTGGSFVTIIDGRQFFLSITHVRNEKEYIYYLYDLGLMEKNYPKSVAKM